jgi:lysophospholipase L1-like esterase
MTILTWIRQAAIILIITIGIIAVPEIALRMSGFQGNQYRSLLFGDDPNSAYLFEESPKLWWKLRKDTYVNFLSTEVQTDKNGFRIIPATTSSISSKKWRVLCIGDSSTFGWKLDIRQKFPFILQKRLSQISGGIEVINAGVPGYSSWQSRLFLEDIIKSVRPHIVIIYSGNNDPSLSRYSDYDRYLLNIKSLVIQNMANKLFLFQYLKGRFTAVKPFKLYGTIDVKVILKMKPRVNLAEYANNINAMIDETLRYDARPVLISSPSNLAQPYFFTVTSVIPEVNELLNKCRASITNKKYKEAEMLLKKAEAIDPQYYDVHFLKGSLLKLTGKQGALLEWEKALEHHPFPERLKPSYTKVLRQLANSRNVQIVDLYQKFIEAPEYPERWFLDACHPNAQGQEFIAKQLEPIIINILNQYNNKQMFQK